MRRFGCCCHVSLAALLCFEEDIYIYICGWGKQTPLNVPGSGVRGRRRGRKSIRRLCSGRWRRDCRRCVLLLLLWLGSRELICRC